MIIKRFLKRIISGARAASVRRMNTNEPLRHLIALAEQYYCAIWADSQPPLAPPVCARASHLPLPPPLTSRRLFGLKWLVVAAARSFLLGSSLKRVLLRPRRASPLRNRNARIRVRGAPLCATQRKEGEKGGPSLSHSNELKKHLKICFYSRIFSPFSPLRLPGQKRPVRPVRLGSARSGAHGAPQRPAGRGRGRRRERSRETGLQGSVTTRSSWRKIHDAEIIFDFICRNFLSIYLFYLLGYNILLWDYKGLF